MIGSQNSVEKSKNKGGLRNFLLDFWNGVEKNPEIFEVDLKMFFYQPSLVGHFILMLSLVESQYYQFGFLTYQTILFITFWFFYLFTHYVREGFMLQTWDVIEEHFGFMLVWGDMVYYPFLYSIPGFFVVANLEKW
jgi:delta14-sterol reductase